ncbi:luciferin 4-monooxygenase-like [Trichoplusia ni]|uniref:Luciferin 4-monooxygenase-like n=1 Tax=Trichoplusia ni TaxID=7111 RepID=A0A7E5VFZ4_TRINI|nr:luciferin 4-monooxygenase-like [Trichoplusia ni]
MRFNMFDVKNENYHLGHLIFDGLRARPNAICQIDAATDKSETNASVLSRSIQLARCFRKFGAKPGFRLALGGNNHLDLHIPYYAAHFNGMPVTGVDPHFKLNQLKTLFKICEPDIAFCEKDMFDTYVNAAKDLGLNVKIVHYGEGEDSMAKFIEQYDDGQKDEEFLPAIFDLDKIYAWMVSTGGTTGVVKLAAFKHKALLRRTMAFKALQEKYEKQEPPEAPNKIALNLSPVQWVSGFYYAATMHVARMTKLMTSAPSSVDHIIDVINKYKPVTAFMSPSVATALIKSKKPCDMTCFDAFVVSGGKVRKELLLQLRERMRPNALAFEFYGQTENLGPVLHQDLKGPLGSCGRELPGLCEVKLVDPDTKRVITEPNVPGEIWTKGAVFTEYYKNPEETATSFSEDGWFKTGDVLYKDEEGYYYFVERVRMRIKFHNYHIIPSEVEAVILQHPGVYEVSVTSIPDEDDGEHIVACVVRKPGADVTAAEIKEIVASNLSDSQRLRGGVVFLDQLPMTSTGKIARGHLREFVLTANRE